MKASTLKVLLIKLGQVNNLHWLHMVVLCFVLMFSTQLISQESTMSVEMDSLQLDDSNISRRYFEDINSKYTDEIFIYEYDLNSSGWWTRFKQWLTDFVKDLLNLKNHEDAVNATNLAIKIAGVILFLLVSYFIVRAILNKEGNWVFGTSSDKSIIPVTDIETNIHNVDFKSLISSAEKNSNFRLAVRYYYLWLLKDLTAAEIIHYDVEKTNTDYQNEIISKDLKQDFSYTSYLYNYIWYGEFDVDSNQFNRAKYAFINFLKRIKA